MIFRLLGFPVLVDNSVAFIGLMWLAYGLRDHEPLPLAVGGVVILFVSILWHELGHAFAARGFGLGPVEISIHGFGGLTRHRPSGRPWKDLVVTLAGPGNGFALGLAALFGYGFLPDGTFQDLVREVAVVNLFWSVFNMLPLFPMDGGQAMHAILRIFLPTYARVLTGSIGMLIAAAVLALAVFLVLNGSASAILLGYFAFTSGVRCWQLLSAA